MKIILCLLLFTISAAQQKTEQAKKNAVRLQAEIDSLTVLMRRVPGELQKIFNDRLNFEVGKFQGRIDERTEKMLADSTMKP